jgi:amino acid transporter
LCLQVLGPKAGLAMFSLNIFAPFFVGQGCTVASSRVVYAYSRDGALPGSRWLKIVNHRTRTPLNAVWFVVAIGALLGLLMFASPIAIGAVFSIGAIAQYTAFIFPVALKLFVVGDKFRPGTFNPTLHHPHPHKLIVLRTMASWPLLQAYRCNCLCMGSAHHSRPLLSRRQRSRSERPDHELHMSHLLRCHAPSDDMVRS